MDEIRSLIDQGKIKEAIERASETVDATVILKARYNNLEKSFNIGLISLNDFKRDEAAITNALIDLL